MRSRRDKAWQAEGRGRQGGVDFRFVNKWEGSLRGQGRVTIWPGRAREGRERAGLPSGLPTGWLALGGYRRGLNEIDIQSL